MFNLFFSVGVFASIAIILLGFANMFAYYSGLYTKGGKAAYLKRHYLFLLGAIILIITLGVSRQILFPEDAKKCSDCTHETRHE